MASSEKACEGNGGGVHTIGVILFSNTKNRVICNSDYNCSDLF